MKRIVVVGGGISGLAAAWSAARSPERPEVLVLEREAEVGGKARSIAKDGWLLEAGPAAFQGGKPELERLIEECGLSSERRTAAPAAAHRFIYRGGKLREIRPNPFGLARSGILSPLGLLRLAAEPFIPRDGSAEETVQGFAMRRLGNEAAERLVGPMVQGIFAGDPSRLSLPAAFPRMAALERDHGSLIRGLIAKRGRMSAGPLSSFEGGMQRLPLCLAERGGFQVRRGSAVRALLRRPDGWTVIADEQHEADVVVMACEPWSAADLLRDVDAEMASDLAGIQGPPIVVVGLGFRAEDAASAPVGFGALVGRGEGIRSLGQLWDSRLFAARAPEGHLLTRTLVGGALDPRVLDLDDAQLLALARSETLRLTGIRAEPVFREVVRWPRAIPQYEIGHQDRVNRIERRAAELGGLVITGNGMRGVAFPDAAAAGLAAGERAAASLGMMQA